MLKEITETLTLSIDEKPLPKGWRLVSLGDICSPSKEIVEPSSERAKSLPYLSLEHVESGTGKILSKATEIISDEGKSTTFYFNENHVLYGKLRPYLNKVSLPDFEGRCTTEIIPLLPNENSIREYIALILRQEKLVDAVMKETTGSRMPRADMKVLFDFKIPLPPTIEEQRRIATILDDQMKAVEEARLAVEAQLKAANLLSNAFLRVVFESEEARNWEKRKLGEIALKIGSGVTPLGGQSAYKQNGIPLIRSQNVHLNRFSYKGLAHISDAQDSAMESSRVFEKDVLLNITGASIGRVCVVPSEVCPANVNQHVSIIRVNGKLNPHYLAFYLSNPDFQDFIFNNQTGATRQALTKALIESFNIPFPATIEEQTKLVEKLEEQMKEVEALKKSLTEKLEAVKKLPAALLRKVFAGEI